MIDVMLSLLVLSAAALFAGAWYLWRKRGNTKQSALMALLGFIMLVNVAIWTIPTSGGDALVDSAAPAKG